MPKKSSGGNAKEKTKPQRAPAKKAPTKAARKEPDVKYQNQFPGKRGGGSNDPGLSLNVPDRQK